MRKQSRSGGPRYGDFPELFWDLRPDAPIDAESPVVLARLLTRARAEIIGKLVSPRVLRDRLDSLPIAENVRVFWRAVLDGTSERTDDRLSHDPAA